MKQLSLPRQKGSPMETAKMVGMYFPDVKQEAALFTAIPTKYLHSDTRLTKVRYNWVGEVHVEDLTQDDIVVTVDSWAYRQRRADGAIVRLRTGGFNKDNEYRTLKLMGVIRDGKLYIVTETSNRRVKDIAPRTPLRIAGVGSAMTRFRKATTA